MRRESRDLDRHDVLWRSAVVDPFQWPRTWDEDHVGTQPLPGLAQPVNGDQGPRTVDVRPDLDLPRHRYRSSVLFAPGVTDTAAGASSAANLASRAPW